jgi:ATP-binding cassette, subfamily B, bacterial
MRRRAGRPSTRRTPDGGPGPSEHDFSKGHRVHTREQTTLRQKGTFLRGMRIVWSYVRAHPVPFSVSVFGAALYAIASVVSATVLGHVTDTILVPAFHGGVSTGAIVGGVAAIVGVALVRSGGIILRRYFSGMAGARMEATLRTRVADRYRDLPLAYHRAQPTGELLAHVEADVEAAVDVLHPVPFASGVILLIVFALVSLVLADPVLSLVGFAFLPALAVLNRSFARRMEEPATRTQRRIGEVSAVAHESIDGALVVKTLGREHQETERLEVRAEQLRGERVRAGFVRAGFEPALEALPSAGIILLLAVGSWRVASGAVTPGTLVRFVALFNLLAWPMRFIGWVLSELPRAVVGRDRLEEVFTEEGSVEPPTSPTPLPDGPLGAFVDGVTFVHDGPPVLNGVAFEVRPKESVAIVGPTGAGKSTLAHLLVRLDDPDYGSVRIGGVDLRHVDVDELRAAASIVFQESFLFAASVRDNISLEADVVTDEAVVQAAKLAQADAFIRRLPQGYDTVVGERGHTLSGGERQRVALARALLREPRVLILDDATSAVDPTIEAAILTGLRRNLDTTLIVVAYRVSTITLADRVLFLDDGRIEASGTHQQLLASSPGYAAMVRAYERRAS